MTYVEDIGAYHCVLNGPYHLEEECPIGRLIPRELRISGTGEAGLCPACEARLEARLRRPAPSGSAQ